MKRVYIGLGSNLNEPIQQLHTAIGHLYALPDTQVIAVSTYYANPAWGNTQQPDFVNAVLEIHTHLAPDTLMKYLLAIEDNMGRVRTEQKWQPRVIDIDMLDYDGQFYQSDVLTVPHPLMTERRFVLKPLSELCPNYVHPNGKSITEYLQALTS